MYFLENIKYEEKKILELNRFINKDFTITKENAISLIENKNVFLKEIGRIDLTNDIIENIIMVFMNSSFIDKENYMEVLISLEEIFLTYENLFYKKLTSEEILNYLKEEFETNEGCTEILSTTSLERLCDKLC